MKNFKNLFLFSKTMLYLVIISLFSFPSFTSEGQTTCSSPNNDANSLGSGGTSGKEPMSIVVPKNQSGVYFTTAPSFKEMLGVNIGVGQGTILNTFNGVGFDGTTKNVKDVFSHYRMFAPSNKDFFYYPTTNPSRPRADQIPNGNIFLSGNKSNLRLLIDPNGRPNVTVAMTDAEFATKSFIVPVDMGNGNIQLVAQSTSNYLNAPKNPYENYINLNYNFAKGIFEQTGKSVIITLSIEANKFSDASADYGFPFGWFRQDESPNGIKDWGSNPADAKKNAKAYAMMLARTYSPKASDCATCGQIANAIEIGNEPWGCFLSASTYNNIVSGFIEGIDAYYGTETANKIKLIPAAFQAHHAENPNLTPSTSPAGTDWRDYMNTRIANNSNDGKCALSGINVHPYSNELNTGSFSLTAHPEKLDNGNASNRFLFIRNAWQWNKDNIVNSATTNDRKIYVSEFGWDSDLCGSGHPAPGVGEPAQAIYTIRNLLMMGRYGVHKAALYEVQDDDNIFAQCSFAHHRGGIWRTNGQAKYIFKALDKFVQKAGHLKFNYAIKEWEGSDNNVFAYILEENGQPKYMVAWRGITANNLNIPQMAGMQNPEHITISDNVSTFVADHTQPQLWWQLDGKDDTPIDPSVYNPSLGVFRLSPIPILIPIRNCATNTFTPGTTTIPVGTTLASVNDIIVPSNSTLTINGTLLMADDKSITVQSNAVLNINGTITNACEGMWNGINIISGGTVNVSGGKIENALDGITSNGSSMITATHATFLNNRRDIQFLDRQQIPANSLFAQCTFKVNNNYRGSIIRSRVSLWNSKGVFFQGCSFLNEHTSPFSLSGNIDYDWLGIYAVASMVSVDKSIGTGIRSSFTNFAVGVRTVSYGPSNSAIVKYTDFDKNVVGIMSDYVGAVDIQNNKFTVRWQNSFPNYDWYRTGILMNTGSGYTIKNNEFVGIGQNGANGSSGSGEYNFGTLILSTGESENRIQSNKYTGLYVGNRVLGHNTNGNSATPSGLQLLCSNHNQSAHDHSIESDWDFNSGIRLKQGNSQDPDGNLFANDGFGNDIWTDTQGFERFYKDDLINFPRLKALSVVGPVNQTSTPFNSSCSTFVMMMAAQPNFVQDVTRAYNLDANLLTSQSIAELTSEFETADAALKTAKSQHKDLIDGGNQAGLMSNINSRWNRDTAALRANLLTQSPNLSSTVLLAVTQLGILKKEALIQVFLANPSACREPKFLRTLKRDMPNLLTDAEIQQLANAPIGRSKRYDLEESININSSNRAEIGKELINNYLANPEANKQELRYWWGKIGSRHALYNLAETYSSDNESNRYEAILRNLNSDLAYSDEYVKENNDYIELYGIKSKIQKSGRNLKQLNASEIVSIRRIANNTRAEAAVQANNILCVAIGECKKLEVPKFPSNMGVAQSIQNRSNNTIQNRFKESETFLVYPNPATGNINISYNLPEKFNDAYFRLVDFTGRELIRQKIDTQKGQLIWQTEQLKIGFYIISIVADNRNVEQIKVSIQK